MKEATIKAKVIKEMAKQGYIAWCPIRNRFSKVDIFTIWDGIFWRGNKMKFLQWTTVSNRASHRKKIKAYFKDNEVYRRTELWCWCDKRKKFIIEKI